MSTQEAQPTPREMAEAAFPSHDGVTSDQRDHAIFAYMQAIEDERERLASHAASPFVKGARVTVFDDASYQCARYIATVARVGNGAFRLKGTARWYSTMTGAYVDSSGGNAPIDYARPYQDSDDAAIVRGHDARAAVKRKADAVAKRADARRQIERMIVLENESIGYSMRCQGERREIIRECRRRIVSEETCVTRHDAEIGKHRAEIERLTAVLERFDADTAQVLS